MTWRWPAISSSRVPTTADCSARRVRRVGFQSLHAGLGVQPAVDGQKTLPLLLVSGHAKYRWMSRWHRPHSSAEVRSTRCAGGGVRLKPDPTLKPAPAVKPDTTSGRPAPQTLRRIGASASRGRPRRSTLVRAQPPPSDETCLPTCVVPALTSPRRRRPRLRPRAREAAVARARRAR